MKKYFKIQNMRKLFINTILITTLMANFCVNSAKAFEKAFLPEKSFIMVNPSKVLSTSTQEEGDEFYFIVPSDLWIEEEKIIPKDSIIKAKITMLKMPVTGINAAMKLETENITFPNGSIYPLKGMLSYKGETQIGGDLTPPLSYNKSLHSRKGEYFNGVIAQYVPSGKYEFGQHVTIMPSEILYIILSEDFKAY